MPSTGGSPPTIGGVNEASLGEVPGCLQSSLSSREREEGTFITHLETLS